MNLGKVIALIAIIFLLGSAQMASATCGLVAGQIATANSNSGNQSSITPSLPANATVGHVIVAWISLNNGSTTLSSISGVSTSWTQVWGITSFGSEHLYAGVVTSAAETVTIDASTSDNISAQIAEFSCAPSSITVDGTPQYTATSGSGTVEPGTALTTSNANDLVLGYAVSLNNSGALGTAPSSPWGDLGALASGSGSSKSYLDGVYQVVTSTGSFQPAWASGPTVWVAAVAAIEVPAPVTGSIGYFVPVQ